MNSLCRLRQHAMTGLHWTYCVNACVVARAPQLLRVLTCLQKTYLFATKGSISGPAGGGDSLGHMSTLVVLRHGESTWNAENRFTGWTDVDLSPAGEAEARSAGKLLSAETDLRIDL